MILRYIVIFYFIFFCSIAKIFSDYEITTSLKCANLFRYYESKYDIPEDLLHAISIKETSKIHSKYKIALAWPWTANVNGQTHYFHTKAEAIKVIKSKIHKGDTSIDIGCLQINLAHHPYAFSNLEEAFDPSFNINYAAYFLRSKYDKFKDWDKAIAHYHSATKIYGDKYRDDVKRIAASIGEHKKKIMNLTYNKPKKNKKNKHSFATNKQITQKEGGISSSLKAKSLKSDMMIYIPKK